MLLPGSAALNAPACLLLTVLLLAQGCTTMQLPAYPTESAAATPQHASQEGVAIGIRPINDKVVCKQYFGTDLAKDHVLAVLVVIENTSPAASFIFQTERAGVRVGGAKQDADRRTVGSTGAAEAMGWTSAGLILASPALALPALLAFGKEMSNASVIKHNFEVNELRSTTLIPGGRTQGFLYFPLPKDRGDAFSGSLQIELVDAATRQPKRFEFDIQPNQ